MLFGGVLHMLKKKRLIPLVISLFYISIILTLNLGYLDSYSIESNSQILIPEDPKMAASWNLPSFIIDDSGGGDYTWIQAANQSWCSGTGTWNDPYMLENITINGGNIGSCITIRNSTAYFIIQNCTLYNSGPLSWPINARIELNNVNNGRLNKNELYLNGSLGISLYYSNNITVSENVIDVTIGEAIGLQYSSNNFILDNTVIGAGPVVHGAYGLNLLESNQNEISGNTIDRNDYDAIILYGCDNNIISGNTVGNGSRGIYLAYCNDNNITDNDIAWFSDQGIYLDNSNNNNITENDINNNGLNGIYSSSSNYSLIYHNNFSNNDMRGIYLSSCSNNLIYYNNFIENGINARDNGVDNDWDNGTIGNYWDDYSGVDNNDDGIGDTPYIISGTAGAQDNFPIWDDGPYVPPVPPEPIDNSFLLILLLSIPLGLLSLITGQSFGKRRKYAKFYADLDLSESKWVKKLESKKHEYNNLSSEIKKIETDQDFELQELRERVKTKEDLLLEGRVEDRILYYKEFEEIIKPLEELREILETEILSKTQLKKNVTALKKAKKAIEEKLDQIKKEHKANLSTIQEVIRTDEEKWKNKRSEMITNQELENKNRENNLEREIEREVQNLEIKYNEVVQRRIQVQKRDALNEKRDRLIKKLRIFEENFLDEIEARIQKLKDDIQNLQVGLSSKHDIKETISIIFSKISTIEDLLNDQRNIESVSDEIVNRILRINNNIRSISSKMELQRASPVLTIPSQEKGFLFTTHKIDFLCELCHRPMKEVEVKERNKWLKWAFLGISTVLEFTNLGYVTPIVEFADDHLIGGAFKEVSGDISSESPLIELVQELKKREVGDDFNVELVDFEGAVQDNESRKKIESIIENHYHFFNDKIKPKYTLHEIQDLCESRERIYWQLFSQDEQENIRRFLKESGNSSLYTSELQLQYGIFVCKDCVNWIEILERKSPTYGGED